MAWSDAARAAALAARRAHAKMRGKPGTANDRRSLYGSLGRKAVPGTIAHRMIHRDANYRGALAMGLRSIRSHGSSVFGTPRQLGRLAAISTFYRNHARKLTRGR